MVQKLSKYLESRLLSNRNRSSPSFFPPATITQPIVTIDEGDVLGITIFVSLTCHRVRTRRRLVRRWRTDGTGGTVMKEDPGPVGLSEGFHKERMR